MNIMHQSVCCPGGWWETPRILTSVHCLRAGNLTACIGPVQYRVRHSDQENTTVRMILLPGIPQNSDMSFLPGVRISDTHFKCLSEMLGVAHRATH